MFFTDLHMADYVWAELTSGRLRLSPALERKTYEDLVAWSVRGGVTLTLGGS